MRQDEFERLNKLLEVMESQASNAGEEHMIEGLRAGVGILERLVTSLEKIAANTAPEINVVVDEAQSDFIGF